MGGGGGEGGHYGGWDEGGGRGEGVVSSTATKKRIGFIFIYFRVGRFSLYLLDCVNLYPSVVSFILSFMVFTL